MHVSVFYVRLGLLDPTFAGLQVTLSVLSGSALPPTSQASGGRLLPTPWHGSPCLPQQTFLHMAVMSPKYRSRLAIPLLQHPSMAPPYHYHI